MGELNEKCGVFGIFGTGLDVSRLAFYGLFALQHRGQESSGIAVSNGWRIDSFKNNGLVTHAYSESDIEKLKGHIAVGHNRYSTSEGSGLLHAQPILSRDRQLALAHNGNLPSVQRLKAFLEGKGFSVAGKADSELMTDAISYYLEQGLSLGDSVKNAYPLFTGAFSVVAMTRDELVAFKDGCGIRPLCMGRLNGGFVFASETCAFNTIGAEFLRELDAGEMVLVNNEGITSAIVVKDAKLRFDSFEFVYFARPDSYLLGKSVYEVRRRCGMRLASDKVIEADIVIPVPETAIPVAMGYSEASGIPTEMALIKNRYIHRTFITPDQHSRDLGVKLKLTPLPEMIRGKRVVVIDDSIVRGTTSKQIVKALFEAGAKEVHFVISSPPVRYPDFYGIDTPYQKKLIAASKSVSEICEFLGADSLTYLSIEGLVECIGIPKENLNLSCFNGDYAIDILERRKEIIIP